jgi:hypothetical protein
VAVIPTPSSADVKERVELLSTFVVCSMVYYTFIFTGCTRIIVAQRPDNLHIRGTGKLEKREVVENA